MRRRFGSFSPLLLGLALAACGASPPGPSPAPSKAPANLDTGTPTRSNLALQREVKRHQEEARALWNDPG